MPSLPSSYPAPLVTGRYNEAPSSFWRELQTSPRRCSELDTELRVPPYPSAITRFGSAIQDAINARFYTNPATLLALSNDPTHGNYETRAIKELNAVLEPLAQAIENFYTEVAELKHVYLSSYGKDAAYSTIGPLRNFSETVVQQ